MASLDTAAIERNFFRALNAVVEPVVRRGFGSPCVQPGGFVVLETKGHKSGKLRRTPLAAVRFGDRVFVSTFRANRSHWLRNLVQEPQAAMWLSGKRRSVDASVLEEPPIRGWGFAALKLENAR